MEISLLRLGMLMEASKVLQQLIKKQRVKIYQKKILNTI